MTALSGKAVWCIHIPDADEYLHMDAETGPVVVAPVAGGHHRARCEFPDEESARQFYPHVVARLGGVIGQLLHSRDYFTIHAELRVGLGIQQRRSARLTGLYATEHTGESLCVWEAVATSNTSRPLRFNTVVMCGMAVAQARAGMHSLQYPDNTIQPTARVDVFNVRCVRCSDVPAIWVPAATIQPVLPEARSRIIQLEDSDGTV